MDMSLPLLPLRDVVVYPYMVIPLFVGRKDSIRALEAAMEEDKQIVLVAQKESNTDAPTADDIYSVGVVATILQLLKLPDGTVKVLVEGSTRVHIASMNKKQGIYTAKVNLLEDMPGTQDENYITALMRTVMNKFEELTKANDKIPAEVAISLKNIDSPGRLADSIAAHMTARIPSRQAVLDAVAIDERLDKLQALLVEELELVSIEKRVHRRVKDEVEKNQRHFYLNQKIKALQEELEDDDSPQGELKVLQKKIETLGLSDEARERASAELKKLKMMPPMSAEATVTRNYLDWLLDLPWDKQSDVCTDLLQAEAVLEDDHYGLDKVKERILEYLAVQQRVDKLKGPILCLVGPPGVGKTSLGESIAKATGREFVRVALGGVRDEAEIRGHRRTYVGALPGKIIQKLKKSGVKNPLFVLDEVDKMAMDYRGDPASALLEVLDPEQNHVFNDHYLEIDYDLSDVMFVATSNSMNIPPALLDRMEVIRLEGYTETEKLKIAQNYLVERQIKQTGLKKSEIKFSATALREIIRTYTREAGVRSLEREIAKICRKVVKEILLAKPGAKKSRSITLRNLEHYLGVKKYRFGLAEADDQVGHVTGLAWTEVGGDILTIEAQVVPGKGKSTHTGHLGDVMQESIEAAMTVVRSRSDQWGVESEYYQKNDFHVHVPEGATPKDGPSAGLAMCVALVSAILGIPVKSDVAMTGEITLRGEALPIGGLKEKLLAALRGGIKHVIIPKENERDLKDLPTEVEEGLTIHPVRWIDEVFALALSRQPEKLTLVKPKVIAPVVGRDARQDDDGQACTH